MACVATATIYERVQHDNEHIPHGPRRGQDVGDAATCIFLKYATAVNSVLCPMSTPGKADRGRAARNFAHVVEQAAQRWALLRLTSQPRGFFVVGYNAVSKEEG